ncbi:MAG: hypothetical protein AB2541_07330 [Candidatus Thiodiazotropha sp.]
MKPKLSIIPEILRIFSFLSLNNLSVYIHRSRDYQFPEYFGKYSKFEMSDPLQALLKLHNISQFSIWNDSKTECEKLETVKMPSHLTGLKKIPMQSFLRETRAYKTINLEHNKTENSWTTVTAVIIVSVIIILIIVWLIVRKSKCYFGQIIGKQFANVHDLGRVDVKQSPPHGEDIEMSALIERRNVDNDSEGQQNTFRRTDATLAWCHK